MKSLIRSVEMLCQEGFQKIGMFLGGQILGLPRDEKDDYVRFFSPQMISIHGARALVGVIGSVDASALKDLERIDRIGKYFVLSLYSANFPALRAPPIFGLSDEEDRGWCRSIAAMAGQFPSRHAQLEQLIALNGEIAGVAVGWMLDPVKR